MTSLLTLRGSAFVPILFFTVFMLLAGCVSRQPAPVIKAGDERPVETQAEPDIIDPPPAESADGDDRDSVQIDEGRGASVQKGPVIQIGLLLPFSHPGEMIGQQAETILAGAELALFERGDSRFILKLADSGATPRQAREAATALKQANADVILGPLLADNIAPVRGVMADSGTPIITFSDNRFDVGNGVWRATIDPEDEVASIIRYARLQGYERFVFFGPANARGKQIETAMRQAVITNGGSMLLSSLYSALETQPDAEAKLCAAIIELAIENGERIALFIPEQGNRLRQIAPLLAYHGVDTREVKLLGTGAWNDPAIWREPSLRGAWFPASPLAATTDFKTRFQYHYGAGLPGQYATLAYDMAAFIMQPSPDNVFNWQKQIADREFMGVNGLFRFDQDGNSVHAFAIMEIDPDSDQGIREVQSVQQSLDVPTS